MALLSTTSIVVGIKLVSGAFQYIINKMITDEVVIGVAGCRVENGVDVPAKFGKAFFNTTFIFASMLALVLPFFLKELREHKKARKLAGLPASHPYNSRAYLLTVIPAVMDVFAVELSMQATKAFSAVTMILLKSMRLVVSALMCKAILGKAQKPYQWAGVLITLAGLIPVGAASMLRAEAQGHEEKKDQPSTSSKLWCLFFVLLGEILRGYRYVFEEKLIKVEKMSAEFVVYTESLIGFGVAILLMVIAHMVPGKNCGSMESLHDTFAMIKNSNLLIGLFVANFLLIGVHNYTTTLITKHLSSMHSMIISQARCIVAWIPNVLLYYVCNRGEAADYFSLLEFVGFGILGYAAFLYNGDIKLPWKSCYPVEVKMKEVSSPVTTAIEDLAEPV